MALTNTVALGTGGATIGSAIGGPIGGVIGTGLGALTGGIADWFSGRKKEKAAKEAARASNGQPGLFQPTNKPGISKYSTVTPQQQQLQNQAIQNILQILQTGNAPGFQGIENEARDNFATKTAPSLAERFGGSGLERTSGPFNEQLAAAGSGLDRQLASLKAQYGQNQLRNLLYPSLMGSSGLTYQKEEAPWNEKLGGDLLNNLPEILKLFQGFGGTGASGNYQSFGDYQSLDTESTRRALENLIPNLIQNGTRNQPGMPGYNYGQFPRTNLLGGG